MEKFFHRIFKLLPSKGEIKKSISHFSKKEYFVFLTLVAVLCFSTLWILENINRSFMVEVPMRGGSITEGILGTPRFVNPILVFSDVDQDLVSLIYSGLMRKDTNGDLVPDMASSYEVSKDGLSYTFTLKDDIYFHDGEPLTVEDILFTIEKAKDPIIKSPKKGSWDGINVEKIDDKTIRFILRQPYAFFLANTTLGILPKHIWENTPIELNTANTSPIGSGPYKLGETNKESSGVINSYDLVPFKKFNLGKPFLGKFTVRFYSNEETLISALEKGEVAQISAINPTKAEILKNKGYRVESLTLPRVFGLFFNQNQNHIFTDKKIVEAINLAINKQQLVDEVLSGYGIMIDGPTPPEILKKDSADINKSYNYEENLKKAEEILTKDGWKKGEDGFMQKNKIENKKSVVSKIEFSISTGNADDLVLAANLIKEDLAKIGIKVDVKTFEIGNLNQSVIRPRKYDTLLFGQIVNNASDLFAFWHSSQRKDPGLNVAMYTNAKVDKILEEASVTINEESRAKKYIQFEDEVKKDKPAIFLYSPDFIYVLSKDIKGFAMENIISPADRFLNSYLWYTKTDNVWKIFSN